MCNLTKIDCSMAGLWWRGWLHVILSETFFFVFSYSLTLANHPPLLYNVDIYFVGLQFHNARFCCLTRGHETHLEVTQNHDSWTHQKPKRQKKKRKSHYTEHVRLEQETNKKEKWTKLLWSRSKEQNSQNNIDGYSFQAPWLHNGVSSFFLSYRSSRISFL